MGWNAVSVTQAASHAEPSAPRRRVLFRPFVLPATGRPSQIYATSEYGGEFPAAIGKDNLFAVQFHTEKSGAVGLKVLQNFSKW
jgi:imidazole glycerol-phosphate synthase subunit HisH